MSVSWRRIFSYVRPYWRRLLIAFVALTLSSGLALLLPLAVRWLVNTIFTLDRTVVIDRVALALLGVFIGQMIFNYIQSYMISYVGERAVADLRIQVYEHLQRMSLSFFNERRVGEITSRVTNDVALIQSISTTSLVQFLQNILSFTGSMVMLFLLSWRLMLVTIMVVPLLVVAALFFGRRLRALSGDVQDRLAEATAVLEETIAGIRIVKSFAREHHEIGRFSEAIESAFNAAMRRTRARSVFVPLVSFFGFGAMTLVLWFGGREVLAGHMSPGSLVAFMLYAGAVAGSLGTFSGLYSQLQEAIGATSRVFGILDEVPEIVERPNAPPLPTIRGSIRFEHVSFSYRGNSTLPVLHDINLEVQPGEVLALVGPSGAGKSTLVNLIPRFYDVSEGRILIDGYDIREVQIRSLREQIGIVPQETVLFSGTVIDNIRYGRLDATMAQIEAAARAANAHDFILELPDGYETIVGERGIKLSGGQRQRISIARALLKDPRILILDEATSALDSESERLVKEALTRLMEGRTSLVIAHRLSTIQHADRIAVLEGGRLVEMGTHRELLVRGGIYAHLYNLQFDINHTAPEPSSRTINALST